MAAINARLGDDGIVYLFTLPQGPNTPAWEMACDNPTALIEALQAVEPDAVAAKHQARIDYLQSQLDAVTEAKAAIMAKVRA